MLRLGRLGQLQVVLLLLQQQVRPLGRQEEQLVEDLQVELSQVVLPKELLLELQRAWQEDQQERSELELVRPPEAPVPPGVTLELWLAERLPQEVLKQLVAQVLVEVKQALEAERSP